MNAENCLKALIKLDSTITNCSKCCDFLVAYETHLNIATQLQPHSQNCPKFLMLNAEKGRAWYPTLLGQTECLNCSSHNHHCIT